MCKRRESFPVRGKRIARLDILGCQVREVFQDLLLVHSACQVTEHVVDSDPRSADTGLAAPLARFDGYDVLITDCFDFTPWKARLATTVSRLTSGSLNTKTNRLKV